MWSHRKKFSIPERRAGFKQTCIIKIISKNHKMEPETKAETKEEKFKRIATFRTQRILEDMRLLGNCANRAGYAYSEEEVGKIFEAIAAKLESTKQLFSTSAPKLKDTFEL